MSVKSLSALKQICYTVLIEEPELWNLGWHLSEKLSKGAVLKDTSMRHLLAQFDVQSIKGQYIPLPAPERKRMVAYRDEQVEVILIAWGAEAYTHVHDHAEDGCLMLGVVGLLEEERYDLELHTKGAQSLRPGKALYIDNREGYHKIRNINPAGSLSLHVYSPPLYHPRQWEI